MKQNEQQNTLAQDSTNAPYWACWPQRLSVDEIKTPQVVVDTFFHHYTLNEIRMLLQELLNAALEQEVGAGGFVSLCDDVTRFIEAVFMTQRNEVSVRVQELLGGHELRS